MKTVNELFSEFLGESISRIVDFIPNILVMFVIVLAGVAIATIARLFIAWILRLFKVDDMAEKGGITSVLSKGGITVSPSRFTAAVFYWTIMTAFVLMGFVALDIEPVNILISEIFAYLPNIFASVLILILGIVLGNFVSKTVLISSGNAGISNAELLSKGARLLVLILSVFMSLDQLGVARGIIVAAFSISFGGIVFAISLAFGLGAKDLAKEHLEKWFRKKEQE